MSHRCGPGRAFWCGCVAVLALSSCSKATTSRLPGTSVQTDIGASRPASETLAPIEAFDFASWNQRFTEQRLTYRTAESRVFLLCAKRKGYTIHPREVDREPELFEPDLPDRRKNGWHLSEAAPPDTVELSEAQQLSSFEDLFGTTSDTIPIDQGLYRGTSQVGGCTGEAIRAVYGSNDVWNDLANGPYRIHNAATAFDSAPERDSAEAAWRSCFQQRGYRFESRDQAKQSFVERYKDHDANRATIADEEVAAAVADAECIIASGLVEMKRHGVEAYLAQLSPEAQAELSRMVDEHNRVARDAPRIQAEADKALGSR